MNEKLKENMKLLNVSQLAILCGLDRKTTAKYLKGVKHEIKDTSKMFKIDDAIPVIIEMVRRNSNTSDSVLQEMRLAELENERLKSARLKLELAVRKNEFVRITEVAESVAKEYNIVRTRLLRIPSKRAVQLARETDPAKIQQMVDDDINEALSELSADTQPIRNNEQETEDKDENESELS